MFTLEIELLLKMKPEALLPEFPLVQMPLPDPPLMVQSDTMHGAVHPAKTITSEFVGEYLFPKLISDIFSIKIREQFEKTSPLRGWGNFWPSIVPPEMLI
jgi:hypothetical protein